MILTVLLPLIAGLAFAGSEHHHAIDTTTPGYQQLTKLTAVLGEWEGKSKRDGSPIHVWYRLVSGGSTLLETEKLGEEPEMITVYHLDKGALVMTHYCSVNNQPHMRAQPSKPEAKQLDFELESTSNLISPDDSQMTKLQLRFPDADHLFQRWTWQEKGKSTFIDIDLSRVKPAAPAKPS